MAEVVLSAHVSLTPEISGSAGWRTQEVIFLAKTGIFVTNRVGA